MQKTKGDADELEMSKKGEKILEKLIGWWRPWNGVESGDLTAENQCSVNLVWVGKKRATTKRGVRSGGRDDKLLRCEPELRERRRERGNARGGATKKREISRTS